jgi:niacin transporter
MMNSKIRNLTYAALLTALAIIIPLYFSMFRVTIGPFTATLASHVPMFISMLLGPGAAVMVGIGSTLGFMTTTPMVVVARASTHIVVGLIGALLLKKGVSYHKVVVITAPIHAALEALAIIPFMGFTSFSYVVGIGTFAHHFTDGIIAFVLIKALARTGRTAFAQNI